MLTNCLIIQTLHFTFSLTDTVRFVADLSSEDRTQNSTYLPSSVISGSYITWLHLLLLYKCISTTWLIVGLASLSSSTLCRANLTKVSIMPTSYLPSTSPVFCALSLHYHRHICLPRHQSFVLCLSTIIHSMNTP